MKFRLFVPLLLIGLLGCAQSDQSGAYDTQANPAGFPQQALNLVNDLESQQLFGLDNITTAFGDLYTNQSDLLDRSDWKEVVGRLGVGFGRIADSLADLGATSWTTAAEYYQLGSFARPEDSTLRTNAAKFGTWLAAEYYPGVDLAPLKDGSEIAPDNLGNLLRFFMTGEQAGRDFYSEQLRPMVQPTAETFDLSTLSRADRALFAYASLADPDTTLPLTRFAEPTIELIAARLSQADSVSYQTEFYFLPREKVAADLNLMIRFEVGDRNYLPMELQPDPPTGSWPIGQLQLVARRFQYDKQITGASIGLVESTPEAMRYLMPEKGDYQFWPMGDAELDLN